MPRSVVAADTQTQEALRRFKADIFQALAHPTRIAIVELLRDGAVIQDREVRLESSPAVHRVRFNAQLAEVGPARLQVRIVQRLLTGFDGQRAQAAVRKSAEGRLPRPDDGDRSHTFSLAK